MVQGTVVGDPEILRPSSEERSIEPIKKCGLIETVMKHGERKKRIRSVKVETQGRSLKQKSKKSSQYLSLPKKNLFLHGRSGGACDLNVLFNRVIDRRKRW